MVYKDIAKLPAGYKEDAMNYGELLDNITESKKKGIHSMGANRLLNKIIEADSTLCVREILESYLNEAEDLKKFECTDCQKVPYGKWKSDAPCSIKVDGNKLSFAFWNTNNDDVDDVLKKWALANQLTVKSIENKKEIPVNGGNVWLYVDLVAESKHYSNRSVMEAAGERMISASDFRSIADPNKYVVKDIYFYQYAMGITGADRYFHIYIKGDGWDTKWAAESWCIDNDMKSYSKKGRGDQGYGDVGAKSRKIEVVKAKEVLNLSTSGYYAPTYYSVPAEETVEFSELDPKDVYRAKTLKTKAPNFAANMSKSIKDPAKWEKRYAAVIAVCGEDSPQANAFLDAKAI